MAVGSVCSSSARFSNRKSSCTRSGSSPAGPRAFLDDVGLLGVRVWGGLFRIGARRPPAFLDRVGLLGGRVFPSVSGNKLIGLVQ